MPNDDELGLAFDRCVMLAQQHTKLAAWHGMASTAIANKQPTITKRQMSTLKKQSSYSMPARLLNCYSKVIGFTAVP